MSTIPPFHVLRLDKFNFFFLTANLSSTYNKKLILVFNMYLLTSSIQTQTTHHKRLDRNSWPNRKPNNIHTRKTNSRFEVGLQVVRIFFWSCTDYNSHIRVCKNWYINTCIWSKFVKCSIYLRITHKTAEKTDHESITSKQRNWSLENFHPLLYLPCFQAKARFNWLTRVLCVLCDQIISRK
jgi:hypothetical protein